MATGFYIGTLYVHYYGLLVMAGVLAATWLAAQEAKRREKPSLFLWDALPWVLFGGIVGARMWHILTPPESMVARGITTRYYLTHFFDAIAIWEGGLGIFGAVIGGSLALFLFARNQGEDFLVWADTIVPGLALAQAIGRWGNFINQEVYGMPTTLPWAIFIDKAHRLPNFRDEAHYHPLFLYASVWNLFVMSALLWIERRYQDRLRRGSLLLTYLILYAIGRFGFEFLRLDASTVVGVNANQIFILVIGILAGIALLWRQRVSSNF